MLSIKGGRGFQSACVIADGNNFWQYFSGHSWLVSTDENLYSSGSSCQNPGVKIVGAATGLNTIVAPVQV